MGNRLFKKRPTLPSTTTNIRRKNPEEIEKRQYSKELDKQTQNNQN